MGPVIDAFKMMKFPILTRARYWFRFRRRVLIKTLSLFFCATLFYVSPCKSVFAEILNTISSVKSGGDFHAYGIPYTGHFTALNGNYFDASQFYESKKPEIHISGFTAFFFPNGWTLKLDWIADLGYSSDLFEVSPSIRSDLIFIRSVENVNIEVGLADFLLLGGNVTESACVDSLYRDFHCGTGLPWVDYYGYKLPRDTKFIFKFSMFF